MNKETAHLYLPLVQALADGELQYQRSDGKWTEVEDVDLCWPPERYRRKPRKSWYRVAEFYNGKESWLLIASERSPETDQIAFFCRWLGDRIEYEVTE